MRAMVPSEPRLVAGFPAWAGALAALIVALTASPGVAQTMAITGATVVDGTGAPPVPHAVVLVEGGHLTCVGTEASCSIPADATRVDVTGGYITPGLVDAHVHFSQTGWLDGRPDGLPAPDIYPYLETSLYNRDHPERWHQSYLCTGITSVFDVGGHPWTTGLPASSESNPRAARVRAAGPLITHATRTALMADEEFYTFLPMDTADEVSESVARLVAMGSSAAKVWYLRPPEDRRAELEARLMQIGREAQAAGLDLIVHATSLREAKMALRAGAVLLVHSVEDQPVDPEFLELLNANEAVYAPTLVVGEFWTRARGAVILNLPPQVDDPNGCVDDTTRAKLLQTHELHPLLPEAQRNPEVFFRGLVSTGQRQATMAENVRRVHAAGGRVATATDAGNPLTLHGPSIYNEMEAMQAAGIPPAEIVVMSTRNGGVAMGRGHELGTLEAGKLADLLVLTDDPTEDIRAFRTLTHVMRGGVLYRQEELRVR